MPRFSYWFLPPLLLVGCAAPAPIGFDLVDQQSVVHHGTIHIAEQTIEAMIAGKHFEGFYLLADSTTVTTTTALSARRSHTFHSVSSIMSNVGRALLTASDGERITCEFLFEDQRAIGDCRASSGQVFQLIANGTKP
jgi:hypothetical protein